MPLVSFQDLGKMPYHLAWELQQTLHKEVLSQKAAIHDSSDLYPSTQKHHFLMVEHPHVYTLGKSGSLDNLLLSEKELEDKDAVFYKVNRGGDITYHGYGQIVGYPILDLECFFTDVGRLIRGVEEAAIRTLAEHGIAAGRASTEPGVWITDADGGNARKICAVGMHLSKWVTMHGFALNVNTDLTYFNYIIPCGITDKSVTSMQAELGHYVDPEMVKAQLKRHYADIFGIVWA